jgi:hypothetical protein
MLIKIYGSGQPVGRIVGKYSPPDVIATETKIIRGNPDQKHIGTSFRRTTQPDDAHVDAPLYFAWYNWVRIHHPLRVTPAMAAG